jgi:hypothetical protein
MITSLDKVAPCSFLYRHCEGGDRPPEAISNMNEEIASSGYALLAMTGGYGNPAPP